MKTGSYKHRPNKSSVRRLSYTPGRQYQAIIDLPGTECLSTLELLNNGALATNPTILAIEANRSRVQPIRTRLAAAKAKLLHVHPGPVQTAPHNLATWDWVNLDTCSSLSRAMLDWIGNCPFRHDAECNVWLTGYRNNAEFLETLKQTFLYDEGRHVYEDLNQRGNLEKMPAEDALSYTAIAYALRWYDFQTAQTIRYQDTANRMSFHRFPGLKRRTTPRWHAIGFSDGIYAPMGYGPKNDRVLTQDMSIVEIVTTLVQYDEPTTYQTYLTRRINQYLTQAIKEDKDPKWVVAGWKATLSRSLSNHKRRQAHTLLDQHAARYREIAI